MAYYLVSLFSLFFLQDLHLKSVRIEEVENMRTAKQLMMREELSTQKHCHILDHVLNVLMIS